MSMRIGVRKVIEKYWWEGFNSGLLLLDGVMLLLCLHDLVHFHSLNLSLVSSIRVAWEAGIEGNSVLLSLSVFLFYMLALPTLWALLSALFNRKDPMDDKQMAMFVHREDYRNGFFFQPGKGKFIAHLSISLFMAMFTAVAMAMEVLSGFSRDVDGHSTYYFVSWWLVIVFLGQPIWAVYVSPIIRKLVVRSADRRKAHPGEVAAEVFTEEGFGEAR